MAETDEALALSLSAWASRELGLIPPPPAAVLLPLVSPPRAAALFRALVERARNPQSVVDARVREALRPKGGDDAGEVEAEEEKVRVLEEEVAALRARVMSKRRRRRKGPGEGAVMRAACAAVLKREAATVEGVLEEVDGIVLEEVREGEEGVACAVEGALQGVRRVREDGGDPEEAERAVGEVVGAFRERDVVDALLRAAVKERRRVEAKVASQTECDEGEGGSDGDDEVVLEEIRLRHMQAFMETEETIADARQLEGDASAALRTDGSPPLSERILLARLAGEHAALAELDRLERDFRTCRSTKAVARDAEVQRVRSLRARVQAASDTVTAQNSALQRLVGECQRLVLVSTASKNALCDTLQDHIPFVCDELQCAAKARVSHSIERVRTVKGLDVERDAEVRVDGAWVPASKLGFLSGEDMQSTQIGELIVGNVCGVDFAIADAGEIEQSAAQINVLNLALAAELERDLLTIRALETRAGLIGDEFLRERRAQEEVLCPELESATSKMKDCTDRLVPAAEKSIEVWWSQPVREAAPWHTVKGRTLKEWELQAVERLSFRRNDPKRSSSNSGSTSQGRNYAVSNATSASSGLRTPDSRTGSAATDDKNRHMRS